VTGISLDSVIREAILLGITFIFKLQSVVGYGHLQFPSAMLPIEQLGQKQGIPQSPLDLLSSFAFKLLMESPQATLLMLESMISTFVPCWSTSPPHFQLHQALSGHARLGN